MRNEEQAEKHLYLPFHAYLCESFFASHMYTAKGSFRAQLNTWCYLFVPLFQLVFAIEFL